jgi:hypothetical protein
MIEQIIDRFAQLEMSRQRWRLAALTLAVVLVVAMAAAAVAILYLREVAVIQIRRADRIEREARDLANQAAAAKDREEPACPVPAADP